MVSQNHALIVSACLCYQFFQSQTSEQAIEDDVEINESRDAVAMEQPVEEGVSSTELDQVQVQQSNGRYGVCLLPTIAQA